MGDNLDKKGVNAPKSLKDAPMPPLPFAHQIQKDEPIKKKDESIGGLLKQVDEMFGIHDKIARMLDEILQKTGWSPKYLESYLSNPNNFTPVQWESINKDKKALMDSILLPEDLKKEEEARKKRPLSAVDAPNDPNLAKERRKKNIGARRNWMPMR